MTDAINFFQSILTFRSIKIEANRHEIELAEALRTDALELAAVGDEEVKNGRTAQNLITKAADQTRGRALAEIAAWHYNRAAEKYRRASAGFDQAGRIHAVRRRALKSQSTEMANRAAAALSAAGRLA